MSFEIGARELIGSTVYDLLTMLSIYGQERPKALKLPTEAAENSSRWSWSRRNERSLQKECSLAKWFRAWIDNPYTMRVWVQIPMVQRKNRRKTLGVMTRMWSVPLMGAIH